MNGHGAVWSSLSPSDLHGTLVPVGMLPGCSTEAAVAAWPRQGSGWTNRPRGATRRSIPEPSAFIMSVLQGVSSCTASRTAQKWVAGNFSPRPCVHVTHFVKSRRAPKHCGRGFKSDRCDFKREEKPLRKENKNPTACCSSCSFRSCGK